LTNFLHPPSIVPSEIETMYDELVRVAAKTGTKLHFTDEPGGEFERLKRREAEAKG
jgi:predicted methyltransferase